MPHLLVRTGLHPNGKTLKTIGAFSAVLGFPGQSRAAASGRKVIYRASYTDKAGHRGSVDALRLRALGRAVEFPSKS